MFSKQILVEMGRAVIYSEGGELKNTELLLFSILPIGHINDKKVVPAERLSDETLGEIGLAFWNAVNGKNAEVDFSDTAIMDIGRITQRNKLTEKEAVEKAQENFSGNLQFLRCNLFKKPELFPQKTWRELNVIDFLKSNKELSDSVFCHYLRQITRIFSLTLDYLAKDQRKKFFSAFEKIDALFRFYKNRSNHQLANDAIKQLRRYLETVSSKLESPKTRAEKNNNTGKENNSLMFKMKNAGEASAQNNSFVFFPPTSGGNISIEFNVKKDDCMDVAKSSSFNEDLLGSEQSFPFPKDSLFNQMD